jgi:hypothetical protein
VLDCNGPASSSINNVLYTAHYHVDIHDCAVHHRHEASQSLVVLLVETNCLQIKLVFASINRVEYARYVISSLTNTYKNALKKKLIPFVHLSTSVAYVLCLQL